MNCHVCDKPVSRTSLLGLCRSCAPKHRNNFAPPPPKHCIDCGKVVSFSNKVGRCISCFGKNQWNEAGPEFRERHMAGIWRKFETDPDYKERVSKRARRLGQVTALDPEIQAKRRAFGKLMYATVLSRPDVRARNIAALKASGPKQRELRLGWCPEPFRARYLYLTKTKHIRAAEARAIVEQEIADAEALKHVSSALDYLRRLAPVKVLENGYQYGNAILRPSEVVERAKLRGWQPERWAA